jgi:hypothetical protein
MNFKIWNLSVADLKVVFCNFNNRLDASGFIGAFKRGKC